MSLSFHLLSSYNSKLFYIPKAFISLGKKGYYEGDKLENPKDSCAQNWQSAIKDTTKNPLLPVKASFLYSTSSKTLTLKKINK